MTDLGWIIVLWVVVPLAYVLGRANGVAREQRESYYRGYEEGWRRRERYGEGGRRPWLRAKGSPRRNPG